MLEYPEDERWRVVRFEVSNNGWISWLHEREWRCAGRVSSSAASIRSLGRTAKEAEKLGKLIHESPNRFKAKPRSIIPLTVICKGLPKAVSARYRSCNKSRVSSRVQGVRLRSTHFGRLPEFQSEDSSGDLYRYLGT